MLLVHALLATTLLENFQAKGFSNSLMKPTVRAVTQKLKMSLNSKETPASSRDTVRSVPFIQVPSWSKRELHFFLFSFPFLRLFLLLFLLLGLKYKDAASLCKRWMSLFFESSGFHGRSKRAARLQPRARHSRKPEDHQKKLRKGDFSCFRDKSWRTNG